MTLILLICEWTNKYAVEDWVISKTKQSKYRPDRKVEWYEKCKKEDGGARHR